MIRRLHLVRNPGARTAVHGGGTTETRLPGGPTVPADTPAAEGFIAERGSGQSAPTGRDGALPCPDTSSTRPNKVRSISAAPTTTKAAETRSSLSSRVSAAAPRNQLACHVLRRWPVPVPTDGLCWQCGAPELHPRSGLCLHHWRATIYDGKPAA